MTMRGISWLSNKNMINVQPANCVTPHHIHWWVVDFEYYNIIVDAIQNNSVSSPLIDFRHDLNPEVRAQLPVTDHVRMLNTPKKSNLTNHFK